MKNAGLSEWLRTAMPLFAVLALVPVGRAGAEPVEIGLEAVGVDVRSALRSNLDVRDAYNRPVSRRLVEGALGSSAKASDPGAELSRLPLASSLWRLMDRVLTGFGLRGELPVPAPSREPGWPWLPQPLVRLLIALFVLAAPVAGALRRGPMLAPATCRSGVPLVLRC